jgi:uncharacterized protein YheU (UPF0270 family)
MKPFIIKINLSTLEIVWIKMIDGKDTTSEYSQSHQYVEQMEASIRTGSIILVFSERMANLDLIPPLTTNETVSRINESYPVSKLEI